MTANPDVTEIPASVQVPSLGDLRFLPLRSGCSLSPTRDPVHCTLAATGRCTAHDQGSTRRTYAFQSRLVGLEESLGNWYPRHPFHGCPWNPLDMGRSRNRADAEAAEQIERTRDNPGGHLVCCQASARKNSANPFIPFAKNLPAFCNLLCPFRAQ